MGTCLLLHTVGATWRRLPAAEGGSNSVPPPHPFMHPFASYVLRSYYKATGWNEDNLYANLTRSSSGASQTAPSQSLADFVQRSSTSLSRTDCTLLSPNRPMRFSRPRTR